MSSFGVIAVSGPGDQDVGREPDAQAMAGADRDRGEPVQEPVENRGRALAEALADARPQPNGEPPAKASPLTTPTAPAAANVLK